MQTPFQISIRPIYMKVTQIDFMSNVNRFERNLKMLILFYQYRIIFWYAYTISNQYIPNIKPIYM